MSTISPRSLGSKHKAALGYFTGYFTMVEETIYGDYTQLPPPEQSEVENPHA